MKKLESREITFCDKCGKETFIFKKCVKCGAEYCFECRKDEGKEYKRGVGWGGTGDGYYCLKCDDELTKSGCDERHNAFRAIESLKIEEESWAEDFCRRRELAENRLDELINHND